MLQKICEMMANEKLLQEAVKLSDSCLRLVYIAAFCISQYGGTQYR